MGLSTYNILKNAKTRNRIEIKDDLLKQLQNSLLEILLDFANVCEKYGYYYSLCGGTALGAVRHKGFIPWDDDIDVFMLRKDYQDFLKKFDKELSSKYYIHSMETTPYMGMPITQLVKKGTILKTNTSFYTDECGIYIDICILDNAPNNVFVRYVHGFISTILGFCLSCARFDKNKEKMLKIYYDAGDDVISVIKRKSKIGKLLRFLSLSKWAQIYSKWNSKYKNNNSKYVVCATGIKHYFGEIFLRDEYCTTKYIEFENHQFKIIKNVDKALNRLYGNYMQLPPENKREHHFVLEIKL